MEQIVSNNIRVQLLSEEIIRIECGKDGKFLDGNTFFIPDKRQYANTCVAYSYNEGVFVSANTNCTYPNTQKLFRL